MKMVYNGETFTETLRPHSTNAKYGVATFTNIPSYGLRDDVSITLYENGEAVSATWTFSIENKAAGLLPYYPNLVKAMMHYSDASKVFFGK